MRFFFVSFLLIVAFATGKAIADVRYIDKAQVLIVSGETNTMQTSDMYNAFKLYPVKKVYFYGTGGLASEIKPQAYLLNREHIPVVIPADEKCVSACAFVAMAADDLTIDGELLFHHVYSPGFPANAMLDEIGQRGQEWGLKQAEHFIRYGYSLRMLKLIIDNTNPCKFMVLSKTDALERMKGDPLETKTTYYNYETTCDDFD